MIMCEYVLAKKRKKTLSFHKNVFYLFVGGYCLWSYLITIPNTHTTYFNNDFVKNAFSLGEIVFKQTLYKKREFFEYVYEKY